jgi:FkbM family methyltransferase
MVMDLDQERGTERAILHHLAVGQFYEPAVSAAMLRMISRGDVVVDVGANVGFFSLLMGLLVGPEGRVIGFEPGENNIPRLIANIALTRLKNIELVEKPASNAAEGISFYLNADDSGGNALWDPGEFPGNERSKSRPQIVTLQATTIDAEITRLALPTPKLIKVDTEGAEHRVLAGARGLLNGCNVPYIIAELHEFGLAKLGSSQMDFRRYMEGFGYDTFAIYNSGCLPKLIPPRTRVASPYITNLLFSTPESIGRLWDYDWFDSSISPTPPRA